MSSFIDGGGAFFQSGPTPGQFMDQSYWREHADQFKKEKIEQLAQYLDDYTPRRFDWIGVLYEKPMQTKSGLHIPQQVIDSEREVSKAFLIVKMGQFCFDENSASEASPSRRVLDIFSLEDMPEVGDWVLARPCDGWPVKIAGVSCKMFRDVDVRMKIKVPGSVW
jgi:hypothetical protein